MTNYSKVDRERQEYDAIDYPCAEPALRNYFKEGLSLHAMPTRRRRFAPGRSTDSLGRSATSEPVTEELRRLRSESAEARCKERDWVKQKRDLEIQVRILQQEKNELKGVVRLLQQRSGTAQHTQTNFRGIPSVEFTCSTG